MKKALLYITIILFSVGGIFAAAFAQTVSISMDQGSVNIISNMVRNQIITLNQQIQQQVDQLNHDAQQSNVDNSVLQTQEAQLTVLEGIDNAYGNYATN